ncbi:MAG: hypothetical protein K8S54_02075 [Spirochaetia bacterium]|nr:hypothetical protein [Spirochaetia bacterium]
MKRIVILNPASRGGKGESLFLQLKPELLSKLGSFDVYKTTERLDATHQVRKLLQRGNVEQILVAGGDGTVNEVVNGYFENGKVINDKVGIGIINLGSGGDFSRALRQMSPDYETALVENRIKKADCGKLTIGDRVIHFMNIASAGVAGDIMFNRENSSFRVGTIAYLYHTLYSLIAYRAKPMQLKWIDPSGASKTMDVSPLNFFACNGRFNGAGMNWAPTATLDDGLFNIVLIAGVSKLQLVLKSNLVYAGRVAEFPGIVQFQTSEIQIGSKFKVKGEADGEIYESSAGQLTYSIVPRAIPLVR